ncbi:hypothetical protein [Chryseobacterium phocaeense]|uniref:hypothetical protein n=1 Tax=Chryseobacterium phocaeense TaxID=1816690 RepID=UPI0009BB47ED|nr:hypothetical protein [Chryseobacterium phocaeense]
MEKYNHSIIVLAMFLFQVSCSQDTSKKAQSANAKTKTSDKTELLCWKDIRVGELPPEGAYYAIDSLVKKWGLCYERVETGCEIDDKTRKLQREAERSNDLYFKSLEHKLGKNWKQQFDKELHIADSINWIKISEQIRSMNK